MCGCSGPFLGNHESSDPLARCYSEIDENAFSVCNNSEDDGPKWHRAMATATVSSEPSCSSKPSGSAIIISVESTNLSEWDGDNSEILVSCSLVQFKP